MSLGELWGFEGHQDIYTCVEDISSPVLHATRQSSEAWKPWRVLSTERWVFCTKQSFLTKKGRSSYRLERPLASQPCTVIKSVCNMSRCSLSKFQAMSYNSPWSRGTERRELWRRVVAQTKRRTVLFDILPKVHNWKKKLWPVRNPGCGGKCFLGWGKQASHPLSCLRHGWTNMRSLASGWKVVMMGNILDGFILNDF